jgi:parallel beta-helix repeat protein
MLRKIVAVWLSISIMFGFVVIVDVITDLTPTVRATTLYVNTTGSGGAYTSIQDAIIASSDGGTVFVYNGTYYEHVVVGKMINLTGEDWNNTIVDAQGSGSSISVRRNWVNVSGFLVRNSGPEEWPGYDAGIDLDDVQYCRIFNNNVSNNTHGIGVMTSHNNNISGNFISNNTCGIRFYPSSFSNNNLIANNNISLNPGRGIQMYDSIKNDIIKNTVSLNGDWGICLSSSSISNNICNNTIFSNKWRGIVISSDSNFIYGNIITSHEISGIYVSLSQSVTIASNTMVENGIYIRGNQVEHYNTHSISSSNIVNGKPVYYMKNQTGGSVPEGAGQIILANCANVEIDNQTLNNCSTGIALSFSMNNNISNIETNGNYIGISIIDSGGNIVRNSNASNNDYGIWLISSSNGNQIFENNITKNQYGIRIDSSTNNVVYHNNFYYNVGSSDVSSNQWDNGYPMGGNYWTDYAGVDIKRGPSQNLDGSDGFGDTPYENIKFGDSKDNYPLMIPFGNYIYLMI